MKEKTLLVGILLLLFYSCSAQFTGSLATFAQYETKLTRGNYTQEEQKIIDNQIKPIIETFKLPVQTHAFEQRANDTLSINYFRALSGSNTTNLYIERNGEKLNEVSDTVKVGDIISLSAPKNEDIPVSGDWVNPGGSYQDPPTKIVSPTEMQEIKEAIAAKYFAKYPYANKLSANSGISVPKFSAEKTRFDTSTGKYIAYNGHPAYIIPAGNGKKFGVQVYCTRTISGRGITTSRQSLTCTNIKKDWLKCPIATEGTIDITIGENLACLTIIDKVFLGENAIQADWALDGPNYYKEQNVVLQAVIGDKKPPVADFDCKTTEGDYYGQKTKFIECNASASHDPDGTIQKYEWDNGLGQGIEYKKQTWGHQGQYSITLKVTDNDGLYDTKTKTINLAQMPTFNQNSQTPPKPAQQPITEFTAEYNKQTKMVEIWTKCNTQNIKVDIDQLDKQANPTNSIIEKTTIPCNQTTPIGPIKTKGAYQASTTINGKTKTAIFTIN